MNLPEKLRALPDYEPPSGGWEQLSARLDARRRGWFATGGGLAMAASVLVAVGLAGLKPLSTTGPSTTAPAVQVASAPQTQVAQLIRTSQQLESQLREARPQVRVWNASRAQRAAMLEQELSRVDAQLGYATHTSDRQQLWNLRVRLMNALLDLHQNQAPALHYASYQY